MAGVILVKPKRFGDDRGWFTETYNTRQFQKLGIDVRFVQDNHSLSHPPYVVRGIHFQHPPHGQDKLVRCIRGSIFDIAVDLRRGSPTYGNWVGTTLSADNGNQLFVPVGFGHAFVTLEANCEVVYKCSDLYAPESDGGIRWDDPTIHVSWPIPAGQSTTISPKDAMLPFLSGFDSPFAYEGTPLDGIVEVN
jgi:dTDP-4-dehydrorhamnose 3,5-epimerase